MISSNYPPNTEIARLTARMLLEVKAVHFNSKNPFVLASGLPSPTYIDCRKLISFPRVRSTLMDFLAVTVLRNVGFEAFDNIAGGETAGIPFAALVAERMGLPMSYIRKKPLQLISLFFFVHRKVVNNFCLLHLESDNNVESYFGPCYSPRPNPFLYRCR